ncbi:reverse transcriptase domain-containing protein, partial [Tanacetum coccineum]
MNWVMVHLELFTTESGEEIDVAIKRINEHVLQGKLQNKNTWRNLCTEAIKLAYLYHLNFVAFYGVVLDGLGGSVAMETDIREKNKKKAKNNQNRARNGKDKVKSKPKSVKVRKSTLTKSKVNQEKKIQLEGLKLPNLKLYYKNKRQRVNGNWGYEDAIVVPEITANNFEIKHGLLNLVQNKQFFGHDKEDPHAHIRYFNKITSTMKFPNVPSTSVKLMLFPFSLEGAARIWLDKEPPRSILTWDDLVLKFINKFFPPSKTINLRNEITRFQQKFDETFYEAWDRFNDLLRGCPHHGFSELHQLDTFYNALNSNDQDSLNSAAGGNFLDKMPRECLKIIESKSKVRQSRSKAIVSKVSTSSSTPAVSSDVAELKDMVRALILDKKNQTPAPVKAVEQSCVTCGGGHSYQNCPATDGNIYHDIPVTDLKWLQIKFDLPVNQPPSYQAPVPQTHGVSKTDFDNYVKANDAVLRNIQNQGQTLQNQMANLTDMLSKFMTSNTASTLGSGTLPGNTITNPEEDLKGITTRSGVAYQGPVIPSTLSCEKANYQIEKFYEIFRDLSFEISFMDA